MPSFDFTIETKSTVSVDADTAADALRKVQSGHKDVFTKKETKSITADESFGGYDEVTRDVGASPRPVRAGQKKDRKPRVSKKMAQLLRAILEHPGMTMDGAVLAAGLETDRAEAKAARHYMTFSKMYDSGLVSCTGTGNRDDQRRWYVTSLGVTMLRVREEESSEWEHSRRLSGVDVAPAFRPVVAAN